jgi:cyclic pyranopterin phosphate synthase
MPREVFGSAYRFLPREQLLTFEEIARLAAVFREAGFRSIRCAHETPFNIVLEARP